MRPPERRENSNKKRFGRGMINDQYERFFSEKLFLGIKEL